tara:strand:- start:1176 stop:1607 length:432 start_codon:yes stop_codon:yes gene_type:complete
MINESDIAYFAGLFDGEGSIDYKQRWERKKKKTGYKRYKTWRISMEVSMTDESVIRWIHEIFKVGTVRKIDKTKGVGGKPHYKPQWRWRCTFREAYQVCRLIWPYTQVKLHKVEQLIDHYSDDYVFDEKVVSLQRYKEAMSLE